MNTVSFKYIKYTKTSLSLLKGSALAALHNELAAKLKVASTKRFSSSSAGVERTWKLLEQVGKDAVGERDPAPKAGAPAAKVVNAGPAASLGTPATAQPKATKAVSGQRRGTNLLAPGHKPIACREGSKQSVLVDKLGRPNGTTMSGLLDALSLGNKPWTEATVRSGFGWDLKQKGYGVRSDFAAGTERFHLVLPVIKGETCAIPPHTPLKGKAKADARQNKLDV